MGNASSATEPTGLAQCLHKGITVSLILNPYSVSVCFCTKGIFLGKPSQYVNWILYSEML